MNIDLVSILSEAGLALSQEAITAITNGWHVQVSPQIVNCGELHRIYAIRHKHLLSGKNEKSMQIAKATEVFVNNLASNISLSGHWVSIQGSEPSAFHVFVLPDQHKALCCFYLTVKRESSDPAGQDR